MNELAFQTEILRSAKETGGYGHKMSDRWKVGVPDLSVAMPSCGIVFFECKALQEVTDNFKRKTGITKIQMETLANYNRTQSEPVGAQLVYVVHQGEQRAIVWPADLEVISSEYVKWEFLWVKRSRKKPNWDVWKLAQAVPRVLSMRF